MEQNARWWESYFVRYFVGTVVGVVLLTALRKYGGLHKEIGDLLPSPGSSEILDATELGAAGLAYCYIASAPVLCLHAGRVRLTGDSFDWCTSMLLVVSVSIMGVAFIPWLSIESTGGYLVLAAFCVVVGVQLGLVAFTAFDQERLTEFYRNLASARMRGNAVRQYVESYRHLREHGNAFLIIIMEFILALTISLVTTVEQMTAVMIAWTTPAALTWFIGTRLEQSIDELRHFD